MLDIELKLAIALELDKEGSCERGAEEILETELIVTVELSDAELIEEETLVFTLLEVVVESELSDEALWLEVFPPPPPPPQAVRINARLHN